MAATDFFIKLLPAVFQRMVDARRVDILDAHRQPGFAGGHVRDAASHQAAPQHAHRLKRTRIDAAAGILFDLGGGKKDLPQRLGLGRHR